MIALIAVLASLAIQAAPAPGCAKPEVPAHVVNAVQVDTPLAAMQNNITGAVIVTVMLDADSHVTSAVVTQSANAVLNKAALLAAKESRYAAAIHDCVSVAGPYLFVVEFQGGQVPVLDPAGVLRGDWKCGTMIQGARSEFVDRHYEVRPNGRQIVMTSGTMTEIFTRNDSRRWERKTDAGVQQQVGTEWRGNWAFMSLNDNIRHTTDFQSAGTLTQRDTYTSTNSTAAPESHILTCMRPGAYEQMMNRAAK